MGKNSRKNKIWNAQLRKEQQEQQNKNGNNELKNKMESKKKGNTKMIKKIEKEMMNAYVKKFGHNTEDISDKEIDLKTQTENFVKNVNFWGNTAKSIDGTNFKVS